MMDNQINMQDTRVIPADYKQTEVGIIPADWDVLPLSKLSTRITDGEHLTPERTEFGYYLLSARNIQNGYLDLSDVDYVGENEYLRIRKRCNPEEGDVLISCSGTIGRISVLPRGIECVMVRSAALVKPSASKLNGHYMQYFLQSKIGQSQIFASLNQGAQANLFLNHIQNIYLALPQKLYEQTAIANVLSDTDALIIALEQLIAKKQAIKTATMQQLLTGRTRLSQFAKYSDGNLKGYKLRELGNIPEDWESEKIGSLLSITTGGKNTQDKIADGSYPFFVRSQTVEKINSYSFDCEGVLTAGDGVGTGKIFHYINSKFDFHQRVYLMFNFSDKLDGYFFYIFFSNNFYDRIMSMTAKSSVDSVRREMIANMTMLLPPKAEQIAIATILSDMDAELVALEQKLAKVHDIKQGMMQQLLTGRVRLPLDHQP